jgi:hypothetical protein
VPEPVDAYVLSGVRGVQPRADTIGATVACELRPTIHEFNTIPRLLSFLECHFGISRSANLSIFLSGVDKSILSGVSQIDAPCPFRNFFLVNSLHFPLTTFSRVSRQPLPEKETGLLVSGMARCGTQTDDAGGFGVIGKLSA